MKKNGIFALKLGFSKCSFGQRQQLLLGIQRAMLTIKVLYTLGLFLSFNQANTLVYRIDVHARLLILRKNFPLHGLILVCTFIDFEKKFPPARLFHPYFVNSNHQIVKIVQSFSKYAFFLTQLCKYTLFQSKRASFKVAVLFYVGLSLIFKKISPCMFINFPENFLPARLF